LNRLAASLTVASTYKDGLQDRGLERIAFPALTFQRLFESTFPLCREYIQPDALVLDHARSVLSDLSDVVRKEDRETVMAELDALSTKAE